MFHSVGNTINSLAVAASNRLLLNVETILNDAKDAEVSGSLKTLSDKATEFGSAGYHIGFLIGTFAALIALIAAGICLMFSNGNDRDEAKKKIIWTIVGAVVVFGAASAVVLISQSSQDLFATGTGSVQK